MSNGPFHPHTQFAPRETDALVFDVLTDLLSDGYNDDQVVIVLPAYGDPTPTHRLTIGVLRQQYEAWRVIQERLAAQELIAKMGSDPVTSREDELTLEWGWRLRNEPTSTHRSLDETEARAVVASAPDLFELVVRQSTAWAPVIPTSIAGSRLRQSNGHRLRRPTEVDTV